MKTLTIICSIGLMLIGRKNNSA